MKVPDYQPMIPPIGEEEALTCLECQYSLTGLTRERCPECGTPFDVGELRDIAAGSAERPATPWESVGGISGFVQTFVMVLFPTTDLTRAFSLRCRLSDAWRYSMWCYSLACAVIVVPLALTPRAWDGPIITVATLPGSVIACVLTELMIAGLLTNLSVRRLSRRQCQPSLWRGWSYYTSGFAVISSIGITLLLQSEIMWRFGRYRPFTTLGWIVIAASCCWWILTWWIFILRQARPGVSVVLVCLAVPFLAIVGIAIGAVFLFFTGGFISVFS